ncbi:MAG TPA: hypothetical protein DCX60_08250 [Phycisphaerales bacterium]|nr:hypothetical protein [Phycisphaerales bacterium]
MYTSDDDWSDRTLGEDTFTFEVETGDLDRIRLDTAFMLSRRGRPIAARFDLDRETGLLRARIPHEGGRVTTAAIILQATLPRIGELKLSTTQLPPRAQPYDLMLELARERLRQYLQKCEDWQMFAPTVAPQAAACFNEARELLSQAVLATDRAREMALARDSIVKAVEAGEMLATRRADLLLHHRYNHSSAAPTTLGFRIDPNRTPPRTVPDEFAEYGVAMIETPWHSVQPTPEAFEFDAIDAWMDWADRLKLPVILGPLVDLRPEVLPDWVRASVSNYTTLGPLLWTFSGALAARYARRPAIWCVTSGVHVNRVARLTDDQMIDLTRRVSVLVRQADRNARTLVELVQPFNDDVAARPGSVPGVSYATRTLDEGVHVDCFGVRLRCGFSTNGSETRDLLSYSDALDQIGRLERPLLLTGFSAPASDAGPGSGSWRQPWCEQQQALWAASMMGVALGKLTHRGEARRSRLSGVFEGVLWAALHDCPVEGSIGLLDEDGSPRRVFTQLAKIRHALRTPLRSDSGTAR